CCVRVIERSATRTLHVRSERWREGPFRPRAANANTAASARRMTTEGRLCSMRTEGWTETRQLGKSATPRGPKPPVRQFGRIVVRLVKPSVLGADCPTVAQATMTGRSLPLLALVLALAACTRTAPVQQASPAVAHFDGGVVTEVELR